MSFWIAPALRVMALVLAALALGLAVSAEAGWGLLVAGLLGTHLFHLHQLRRLTVWLEHIDKLQPEEVPESFGSWGNAYAALYRLRRDDQVGRDRLSASLQRLSQAAEALPDGVVLLDANLRIEWCNAAAMRHLGLDAVRDNGTPITHLVREPTFAAYVQDIGAEPVILRSSPAPGRSLALSLIPFAESGCLLISRDITAIELADTVRRDFVANVSHELRTPLTVIVGFLEGLVDCEAGHPSPIARQLALMYEQAQRMERLVKDLLILSSLEVNNSPANEEVVDVPAMLETLLEEGRVLSAGRHELALEVSVGALYASHDELRSAFSNLISNAIRYTPEHGCGCITLRWSERDGQPIFEVADSGIGIEPEHISRLTERFYRVDKGRSSATGGTGLGLAIVKHVLIRHQARLEIESAPGKGSTFRAVFPSERRAQ